MPQIFVARFLHALMGGSTPDLSPQTHPQWAKNKFPQMPGQLK